jgi:hypothetical protein
MEAVAAGEDPLAPDNRLKRVRHSPLFSAKNAREPRQKHRLEKGGKIWKSGNQEKSKRTKHS